MKAWFVVVFCFASFSSQSEILTSGDWQYYIEDFPSSTPGNFEAGVVIWKYNGVSGSVTVPSTINGITVRRVGGFTNGVSSQVLGWDNTIVTTNLIIPNTVTDLGMEAFSSSSLISVTLPSTITNWGSRTFAYSRDLALVNIPEGIQWIGEGAFAGCSSLTNITLPNSLKIIEQGAFSQTGLTSLIIPNGTESIGDAAFGGSPALTNIIIANSVTNLGSFAFENTHNLTEITLPQRFLADSSRLGLKGEIAASNLIQSLATSLSTNPVFINNLAQAILAASNNYGLATKTGVSNTITTLATKTELTNALTESRADGINSVISNPNLWTLYTTNQIKAMVMGDLMLTRTNNGQFVLNYDIEQSDDLSNWAPYAGYALPLTNLPTDKAFVRIKLKNQL